LTHDEYRRALDALGLSQREAGECFGFVLRTSQAYALGESPIPEPTARLIKLVVEWGIDPHHIPHSDA